MMNGLQMDQKMRHANGLKRKHIDCNYSDVTKSHGVIEQQSSPGHIQAIAESVKVASNVSAVSTSLFRERISILQKLCACIVLASILPVYPTSSAFADHVTTNSTGPEKLAGPRIVNVYNFIRNEDYRFEDSKRHLYDATYKQVELFTKHQLPATWALQYDALINPKYQKLLKEKIGPHDEIGAWWELPRALVEKAGIKWRGNHDWVSTANIAFSPGYSPNDRKKLVDVYMADFKDIFGYYPRSVGSWYIDEVTLAYMADKYGIIASCNCKDQVGTDGYTLWGGYWNQAYYPSRLNAYMPAQSRAKQINVPIFRMLGSDPIYQYGRARGITSLEPVYRKSGGSQKWVTWFLNSLSQEPCLAFGYAQAGQENSFGWNGMGRGLEMQAKILKSRVDAGEIRVETLASSGEWFRKQFPLTPATSFVCLRDWRNEGRKTVWYNSRFYRLNLFWDEHGIVIRDIHRFDETRPSVNHDAALTESTMSFGTLPIVEGVAPFSKTTTGAFPKHKLPTGKIARLPMGGPPIVTQHNRSELIVTQPLLGRGKLTIHCKENQINLSVTTALGEPPEWTLDFLGQATVPQSIVENVATYRANSGSYQISLAAGGGTFFKHKDDQLRIQSSSDGRITLILGELKN